MIREIIEAILNAELKNDSKLVVDAKELSRKKTEIELKKGRVEYLESVNSYLKSKLTRLLIFFIMFVILFLIMYIIFLLIKSDFVCKLFDKSIECNTKSNIKDVLLFLIPYLIMGMTYFITEITNTSNVKISVEKELYETLSWLKLERELDEQGESDLKEYTEKYIKKSHWKKIKKIFKRK